MYVSVLILRLERMQIVLLLMVPNAFLSNFAFPDSTITLCNLGRYFTPRTNSGK